MLNVLSIIKRVELIDYIIEPSPPFWGALIPPPPPPPE